MGRNWRRRCKLVLFATTPALVLLVTVEAVFRLLFPLPPIVPTTPEVYEDRDLFWRVRPNLDTTCVRGGKRLRTNRLGFREGPIGPKPPNEFRVLCLGESTTYGDHVEFEQTYPQVAQRCLNDSSESLRYRLLNAGAPSYSSFQSLVLLKKYGLDLEPDAVVLYHEGNDYLPVGWDKRDLTALTDPERYRRNQSAPLSWWLSRLRFYRVSASWLYRNEPDPAMLDRVYSLFGNRLPGVQTRLTEEQQYATLQEFQRVCAEAKIALFLMHPTYAASVRHTCPLTDFARRENVPLLETLQLFARRGKNWRFALFADPAHPNAEGHRLLGEALADLLRAEHAVPR